MPQTQYIHFLGESTYLSSGNTELWLVKPKLTRTHVDVYKVVSHGALK